MWYAYTLEPFQKYTTRSVSVCLHSKTSLWLMVSHIISLFTALNTNTVSLFSSCQDCEPSHIPSSRICNDTSEKNVLPCRKPFLFMGAIQCKRVNGKSFTVLASIKQKITTCYTEICELRTILIRRSFSPTLSLTFLLSPRSIPMAATCMCSNKEDLSLLLHGYFCPAIPKSWGYGDGCKNIRREKRDALLIMAGLGRPSINFPFIPPLSTLQHAMYLSLSMTYQQAVEWTINAFSTPAPFNVTRSSGDLYLSLSLSPSLWFPFE